MALYGDRRSHLEGWAICPAGQWAIDKRIFVVPADITDYDSVRAPLTGKAPLFIVTDGMLSYLTESEAVIAVDNIVYVSVQRDGSADL